MSSGIIPKISTEKLEFVAAQERRELTPSADLRPLAPPGAQPPTLQDSVTLTIPRSRGVSSEVLDNPEQTAAAISSAIRKSGDISALHADIDVNRLLALLDDEVTSPEESR